MPGQVSLALTRRLSGDNHIPVFWEYATGEPWKNRNLGARKLDTGKTQTCRVAISGPRKWLSVLRSSRQAGHQHLGEIIQATSQIEVSIFTFDASELSPRGYWSRKGALPTGQYSVPVLSWGPSLLPREQHISHLDQRKVGPIQLGVSHAFPLRIYGRSNTGRVILGRDHNCVRVSWWKAAGR